MKGTGQRQGTIVRITKRVTVRVRVRVNQGKS